MRYGEDNYENNFLDDFSVYGGYGGLPATTYTPPAATYTPPAATYTAPTARPMAQPVNQYFNDTPLERNIREDTLRGVRWLGGEGVLEKDVGRQEGGLGRFQPRPVVDLRYDPTFSGSEFSPTLGQSLSDLRSADLYGITGSQSSETGGLFATPGASYRLMVGGKEIGTASTPQEMERLAALASEVGGNKKADVRIQGKFGPTQDWTDTFINAPDVSGAGVFADFVLPAIGGVLLPGVGGVLGGALGAGLGAAAGSGLSSALQGRSLEDALTRAALSGVTAGGLSAASGTPLMSAAGAKASALGSGLVPSDIAGTGSLGFTLNVPVAPTPNFTAGGLGLGGVSGIGADALDDIVVTGARNAATSSFLPTLPPFTFDPSVIPQVDVPRVAPPAAEAESDYQPGDDPVLTSTAPRPVSTTVPPPGGALPAVSDAIRFIVDPAEVAGQIATQSATTEEPEALAEADRIKRFEAEAAAAAAAGALPAAAANTGALPATTATTAEPEALAEADRIKRFEAEAAAAAAAAGGAGSDTSNTSTDKKDGVLSKINPVRAGLSALAGLVSLLGGGGGGGGRGVPTGNAGAGTRASLDPRFSAKLPAASPQYSGMSLAPRDMRGVDFARYGYGPGASFFENVPRNPEEYRAALAANTPTARPSGALNLPPMPMPQTETGATADPTATATSLIRTYIPSATDAEITDFLATEEGMQFLANFGVPVRRARGGSMRGTGTSRGSYAVKGAGTGRSDEIPALLSDGEYVMDAETVAMLGDGSSEAGAKRLDDFRINVRKHKGRNLAKGKFSANAKRPEKYLTGGRA